MTELVPKEWRPLKPMLLNIIIYRLKLHVKTVFEVKNGYNNNSQISWLYKLKTEISGNWRS